VDRPRPSAELVSVRDVATGSSFPSGHAMTTVLLYGFLFYAAGEALPDRRLRYPVQALCVVIAVLTGLQRVEAGVHWPSDVLGGVLLGGLILALLIWSHRRFEPDGRRSRQQDMNWLDAVIVIALIGFTVAAFRAGLIREVVTLVAVVVGVLVAGHYYDDLADDVLLFIKNDKAAKVIAFLSLFGSVALLGS